MATSSIPNAEDVHLSFVAQNEWAKILRFASFIVEALAAALAIWSIVEPQAHLAPWRPILGFCLLLIGVLLREHGEKEHLLAQECRRESLRALIRAVDVPKERAIRLRDRVIGVASILSNWMPAKSIWNYYGPAEKLQPAGGLRMRQLYSYSAFYTWRQAKVAQLLAFVCSGIVFVASAIIVYAFAITQSGGANLPTLDVLCTIILGFVFVRLFALSRKAGDTSRNCERISAELLRVDKTHDSEIENCADEYDYERVSGFQPGTILYLVMRKSLDSKWEQRRQVFDVTGTPPPA